MEKQELNINPGLEIVRFGVVDIVGAGRFLGEEELPLWGIR